MVNKMVMIDFLVLVLKSLFFVDNEILESLNVERSSKHCRIQCIRFS